MNVETTWAEEMDTPKIPCPGNLKSPQLVSSIQRDFRSTTLKQIQNLRRNYDSPEKLPTAPHSSPTSVDASTNSRLGDHYTFELLKACSTSFSCDSNSPGNPEDIATSNPLPLESSPIESAEEKDSVKSRLPELECVSPIRLPYSLSNMSLSDDSRSLFNDSTSLLVHRDSDVSDISMTESQTKLSDDDAVDSRKLEGYDKMDPENPIGCWKVYSPRRPRSSVGEFLSWRNKRKNTRTRRKLRSADNIYIPFDKSGKDERNSEFLKTI